LISAAEAIDFLDYFCDGAAHTDHAVMIDAPWGAGKTHFIKPYLASRDAAARKNDDLIGAPFLYASLYGVSTIDEIREQFFTQAYPILGSVPVKMIGTALAGVVKKFTGADFNPDDAKGKLPLDAKVLVFDDLERAAMPLVDALGLINTFVEHGNHKVILIANQAEVPEDQKTAYDRQREKVIGRTLTIRSDPAAVLDKLIGEMRYEAARAATEANRELVIRIFEGSKLLNLRSLRAAVADFDRLVGALDPKLAGAPDALRRLLAYIVATEVEWRAGLARRELDALMSVRIDFGPLRPSEAPEIKKAETLQAKYPEVEWRDPIIPAATLADYLVTGVLDVEAANQAVLMHPLIAEPKAIPAWRRLIDWQLRGPEAYVIDRDDVREELQNHQIVEPGEICHIAGVAIWLERMGAPLLTDVEDYMDRYIDAIEASGALRPERSIFGNGGFSGWAGFAFCCAEDSRFARIEGHLEAAVARVFDKNMQAAAPTLMAQLRRPEDDGKALFDASPGETGRYGGVAILHHVVVADFADLLLDGGRANRDLLAALARRYQYWGAGAELLVERPWLDLLQKELDVRANALGAPFDQALKQSWARPFAEMFGMLNLGQQRAEAARAEAQSSAGPPAAPAIARKRPTKPKP
jgi:hypothetical protein